MVEVTRRHRELAYKVVEGVTYDSSSPDGRAWIDGLSVIGEYDLELAVAQALADIEEATLSKGAGQWIPVGERMPSVYDTVLIHVPEAIGPKVRAVYRRADEGFHEKLDAGAKDGRDFHWHVTEVTHWMPLPAPPEQGAKSDG